MVISVKRCLFFLVLVVSTVFFGCSKLSHADDNNVFSPTSDSIIKLQISGSRHLDSIYNLINTIDDLEKKSELCVKILRRIPAKNFKDILNEAATYFNKTGNQKAIHSFYLLRLNSFIALHKKDSFEHYAAKIISWANKNNNFDFVYYTNILRGYLYSHSREYDASDSILYQSLREAKSKKMLAPGLLAQGLFYLGRNKSVKYELDKGLIILKNAALLGRMANDYDILSDVYFRLGEIYLTTYDLNSALEAYGKSLAYAQMVNDEQVLAYDYSAIGEIYMNKEMNKLANSYYWKSFNLSSEIKDYYQCGYVMSNLATLAQNENEYITSLKYYDQSNEFFLKLGERSLHNRELCRNDLYKGITLVQMGKIEDAEKLLLNLEKATAISEDIGMKIELLNGFSEIALYKGKVNEAEKLALEVIKLSKENEIVSTEQVGAELMARILEKKNDFKNAIKYHKESWRLTDSTTNKQQIQKFADLENEMKQNKFKADQFKLQAKLQTEKVLRESELKRQRITSVLAICCIGILSVFVFFIYRGLQENKKKTKIISEQKKEVELQKEIIEEKKKEVMDSISYAKKIQEAILPSDHSVAEAFAQSFIFYKPKDIVAGDFYWLEKTGDTILIAAGDCTGHGVPGAMVSVVCSNALNRAVKEFGLNNPGMILDKVRELVIETFAKSGSEVKDGMDISLVSIPVNYSDNIILKWAGANNPLWYISDGIINEIKANKQPVGKHISQESFTTHELLLKKGNIIYLITDGFADQFGGPKGKKFKYKNLKELLQENSELTLRNQKELLVQSFDSWKLNLEQVDDVTIIGLKL